MTRTTEEIVALCDRLYYDLEFEPARAWKAAEPGRKVVGFLPVFAPRELIHAAGALPIHVIGAGDWLEVIRGDAYYQSYLCHIPRSIVELALSGKLDFCDGMLFPSTCDVIRNLSGMWQMMKPEMYVRYVDVPQTFQPEVGGKFWKHEMRALVSELEELTGIEVTEERLATSIHVYNQNRDAVEELYALRREHPERAPTSEAYLVLRAGNVMPVEEHTALVREYIQAARAQERPWMDSSRVVLWGTFCEQPPIKAFLENSVKTAVIYSPEEGRGNVLVDRVRAAAADGVIFAAPSFCTPALLDQPMMVEALEREGIPYTAFKYAENTGQFQPIREQTGTFADTMKLWSVA